MTNIPKSLIVSNLSYKVKFKHMANAYGLFDPVKQLIQLDPKNNPERQLETFIHEIIHLIIDATNLKIVLQNKNIDEELIAHGMASPLTEVIKQLIEENK